MMKERATYLFKETSIGPLNIVNKWIQDHRLEINYDKSCYIIASIKKFSHIPSLRINNHKITHSVNLKYLGVLIDSKLTWNAHLNYVKDKINKVQNKLNRFCRATWGLEPKVKKDIYEKVMEKLITYGHEVWYRKTVKQDIKINQLQRIALINVTKVYKTVSSEAINILAGVPPLNIKLQNLQKFYDLKTHDCISGHRQHYILYNVKREECISGDSECTTGDRFHYRESSLFSRSSLVYDDLLLQDGLDAEQMTRVLDALDQDITNLHQTVHDLEDRTLRAVRKRSSANVRFCLSHTEFY
ncbi:RNase H domain-containing protein [Caerostris darwini]|uniref:RNase H domain-containing protein n=1 Tax=Caerostris darwini TaxID=1538125 RepID=A0AAV4V716_9ARAC|nr:RNase H domain-containing protein [Caerostris darwini]